jgi:hypothetical protein
MLRVESIAIVDFRSNDDYDHSLMRIQEQDITGNPKSIACQWCYSPLIQVFQILPNLPAAESDLMP